MKRIITLLIILSSFSTLFAQRDLTEHRPVWFGVNMGGTWQTSDMKPIGGIGWGFTVARYSRISNPSPIYWGWRFRFLDGRNFGYNYHALYGVKNNPVLSPYYSNTDPDTGFVYSNYKMRLDEFAGEIIIGSNTLRKHGVLLYGWGGVGMTYWKTQTDLLDVTGNVYDYSTITDNGNEDAISTQLDALWGDNLDYETEANGSSTGQWGFMPSAGIGFGYQWSNFSIAMEHKTTWALNDLIDGTSHNSAGAATEHLNDIYHYDGLSIKWNFHKPRETTYTNDPLPPMPDKTQYNQPTPTPQPTPVDPNPNPQPQPTPNIPGLQPPTVTFTTPSTDPYTANTTNQNLVVRVTNVAQSNQISLQINNQVSTNFSFNPATSTMTFSHVLNPGTNTYRVVATNSVGSAQDVQTIIYKEGDNTPTGNPPTVVITDPNLETWTASAPTYGVKANVTNVANASGITVKQNGNSITNFSYDPRTKVVSFTATLASGNNNIIITATNQYGNASDACNIVYGNNNTPVNPPPVVAITNPNACPYQTKVQNHTLSATIQNVTQKSQVAVVFNGQTISNFTFSSHGMVATVTFPVVLNSGVNNFSVTGTNSVGTDSKSCQITYKPSNGPQPPDVEITSPSTSPFASPTPAFTLKATVLNVASSAEITMTANNATITGWSYDMNSKVLTYSTTLQGGSITYVITATNANGTDNDAQVVTYKYVPPVDPNSNVPVDPNQSGGTSRPGETTVSPNGNVGGGQQGGGGSRPGDVVSPNGNVGGVQQGGGGSRPGDVVSPNGNVGGGQQSGGGSSKPGETTVSPNGNVGGDPNQSGGGSKPTGPAPTIDLHVPSMSPVSTGTTSFPVTMIVNGVNSASDITVRVNQVIMTSGISYNSSTKQLTFTATLVNGQNSVQVKAVNANGQATKTLIVNCSAASRQQQSNDPEPAPAPKKDEPKNDPKPAKSEPKKDEPKNNPKPEPKSDPKPAPKDSPKPEPKKEDPKPAPSGGGRTTSPPPAPPPAPKPR